MPASSPDAEGCVRPVPMVATPVPETAAAPRRRRMLTFAARSAAWWWRWGPVGAPHAGRARGGLVPGEEARVRVSREMC